MDNSNSSPSNSIEKQIDNFLEHFKRSASKAMDADWCSTTNSAASNSVHAAGNIISNGNTAQQPHMLQRTKSRSSCLDVSELSEGSVPDTPPQVDLPTLAPALPTLTPNPTNTSKYKKIIIEAKPKPSTSATIPKYTTMPPLTRTPTPHTITSVAPPAAPSPVPPAVVNQADSDSQLFSTLCEIDKHNYLYLFERCKACNVNARQLRYFEKEHIRELVPKSQLGVWAEFEYLLFEWKLRNSYNSVESVHAAIAAQYEAAATNGHTSNGADSSSRTTSTTRPVRMEPPVVNTQEPIEFAAVFGLPSTSAAAGGSRYASEEDLLGAASFNRYEEESRSSYMASPVGDEMVTEAKNEYPLTTIIPNVLTKCQQKYKANRGLLTEVERRQLSSAIIDYFLDQKIHLKSQTIDNLAEQVTQHFPSESKRDWYDRKNNKGRGRLYAKLCNTQRSKYKSSSTSSKKRKLDDNNSSASEYSFQEDDTTSEVDEEAQQIQNWLKCNKCEDMDEVTNMWNESTNYRSSQLRRIQQGCDESVVEVLESWPSYKWVQGHALLNLDFETMHPLSMDAFRQRWPIFTSKIVTLMETELKDSACVELFNQFKMAQNILNEDSAGCTLIYLLHAITKPSRGFSTPQGVRRFCITDSQQAVMRLVSHSSDIDAYAEEHPCVFAVGDSWLNVEECCVAYRRDIRYKLKFTDAFAVAFQLYMLFRIDYPLAALNFWQFVRGYLFDIQLEHETSYAVMDNIVKYLDTDVATTP